MKGDYIMFNWEEYEAYLETKTTEEIKYISFILWMKDHWDRDDWAREGCIDRVLARRRKAEQQ